MQTRAYLSGFHDICLTDFSEGQELLLPIMDI